MSKKERKDRHAMAEEPPATAEGAAHGGADAVPEAIPAPAPSDTAAGNSSPREGRPGQVALESAAVAMPAEAAAPAPASENAAAARAERAPANAPMDAWIELDALDSSARFQLCPEGEVDALATSIVRDGQLFAIDVRPTSSGRFEIVCGFRRVAALRLLMRRKVLAHIHPDLGDADALALALAAIVDARRVDTQMLEALRDRLDAEQRLTPMLAEILTRAITPEALELSPETVDGALPSPDPCALVQRILDRLALLNQELSQLAGCWEALPKEVRDAVLQQLVYPSQMARYLKKQPGGLF